MCLPRSGAPGSRCSVCMPRTEIMRSWGCGLPLVPSVRHPGNTTSRGHQRGGHLPWRVPRRATPAASDATGSSRRQPVGVLSMCAVSWPAFRAGSKPGPSHPVCSERRSLKVPCPFRYPLASHGAPMQTAGSRPAHADRPGWQDERQGDDRKNQEQHKSMTPPETSAVSLQWV